MDLITSKEDFLKNPNLVPLNKLYLNYKYVIRSSKEVTNLEQMLSDVQKSPVSNKWSSRYQIKSDKKSALDKCWLQKERRYVEYHQFYLQFDENENDQFLVKNQEFLENLQYLLTCSYHQFWCNIVCEPQTSLIIKSFLRNAVSPYGVSYMSERCQALYNKIYNCVCKIYERLLNFNYSKTEYLEEDVARKYLRETELISIRYIYAFCSYYNHSCPQFVKKLINFYFDNKSKSSYVKEITDLLLDVKQDLEAFGGSALGLISDAQSKFGIRPKPDGFDPIWLEEMSSYALEIASSLNEFLILYKPAIEIGFELQLPNVISHVYKRIYSDFHEMYESESPVQYDWSKYKRLINIWVPLGKSQFLDLFHQFTSHLHDNILKLKTYSEEQNVTLERYLEMISFALDDDLFIKDYNKKYPIGAQLEKISAKIPTFDETQSDYILKGLAPIIAEPDPNQKEFETKAIKPNIPSPRVSNELLLEQYEAVYDTLQQYLEVSSIASNGPSTSSAGSKSKYLPEPVLIALKQYIELKKCWNDSPQQQLNISSSFKQSNANKPSEDEIEQRIKAVSEMLPDLDTLFILQCLEEMDYRPEQVISRVLDGDLPSSLLNMGFNDIIPADSEPKPMKAIGYVGKKPGHQDALSLLNDKNEDIKNLVLKASNNYDLDDDFDERDELYGSHKKGYERIQQTDISEYATISDPSSNSEDEDEVKPSSGAFCEDPAVIRARREAQRGRNYRGSTRNQDLVGKPKGQHQDSTVLQNRDSKGVHKSARANHNRKGGAQWKRNRGMMHS